ncbi:two-component sensor histidine kinase [Paenibacillus sp. 598K]|uniref:sensor histidine kinase n=1 Tax=Paenibacillus sp. 598K TaxID=1117987 RepID=UPI000FF95288|nr:HAMP domain-containing sensor histidine kinase [Paenibacillus sp. 598K]GBF73945.1 two-component sensor histidine kinase [Paenibacillus sp. 598K]
MLLAMLFIIFATATGLLLIHLLRLRREIVRMTKQLLLSNEKAQGVKIRLSLFDRTLEGLAEQINGQSRLIDEKEALRDRKQREFRQAIAHISHDIRTPLTSIQGYVQMMETANITAEEKREYISIIKNRTLRLQTLLHDFYELTIIESPDYELSREPLDLTSLLYETLFHYFDLFQSRGITPVLGLTEEKLMVRGDEHAIKRVIENLLANTAKHGEAPVEIYLQRDQENAALTIVNEARGLNESEVRLLFDRFYTVDRARASQTSGLGLAIAQQSMIKMGGMLTAELKEGRLTMNCRWPLE